MLRKILSLGTNRLVCNENLPTDQSSVRAFATQAALATSVEASPAVLINLWDHGHRWLPTTSAVRGAAPARFRWARDGCRPPPSPPRSA